MTCKLSGVVSPCFAKVHREIKAGNVKELVAKGGRGSTKSSYISIELILQLTKHPQCHAAVFRKVGNTLRTSVYAQIVWAINELGLHDNFRCTVSPMECTYLPTGQKVLFFGVDDPGKVKSIKVPFGYIGICWFEELDQFDGEEQIRNVEQSCLRGGDWFITFKSFNPPAMARNWANGYALKQRPGKLIHHSTYKTTPAEWLGERFLADAEYLERTNETAYRHEYLGEVVGSGTAVFENLRIEKITDEQIASFDRIKRGVDWGWYPDPWAYNAMHYDAARRTLYIFDELTRRRTSNRDTAQLLLDRGLTREDIDMLTKKLYEDFQAFDSAAVSAGNQTATAIKASYVPLDLKTDKFESCVTRCIKGILAVAGLDGDPTYTRNQIINKQEEAQTVLLGAEYYDDEYITKKLLTILGDADQYDELINRKAAEELDRTTNGEE